VSTSENLPARGRNLEDEFFYREDQRLLARLREKREAEAAREALCKATGIANPAVLDKLMGLEIKPETVAALSLVPLVEVAWADGSLDEKERKALLTGAEAAGVAPGSVEASLLEAWSKRRPEPKLLTAWIHLVQGMCENLAPDDVAKLKSGLLEKARSVARASGGTLGLGSKVSASESRMLEQLEQAFRGSR
jgi:hypothetical protein